MSATMLYTDLSRYYDLMCADINYQEQTAFVQRLHQLFGNECKRHLDLGCGTGPHIRHFLDAGFESSGLDINQPMLDIAQARCPEATFLQADMSNFVTEKQFDLITCFLYSIHYNQSIKNLTDCIASAYAALKPGGMFCFNAVDKNAIDNSDGIKRLLNHNKSQFVFQSGWRYSGEGDKQVLRVAITRTTDSHTEFWQDEHSMVALSFQQLQEILAPYFELHIFEHVYDKILPWNKISGNAIFVGIKKAC